VIPAEAFERLLLTRPQLCLTLCRVLVGKLRTAGQQLDETIFLSARETVSRVLAELQDRQLLRFVDRQMEIADLGALRRLAETREAPLRP
jgi:CRP-like cAMP-binding protein